ncbi:hypothetical protein [Nocardioides daejeonensis]|uniref:hypothetical protein n=1 Tax=Nocardioides daejeonensis TaxID=1046556 RepID=UPI0013A5AEBD|nr:hypothetical protein [Nocardioides daejeonensis]
MGRRGAREVWVLALVAVIALLGAALLNVAPVSSPTASGVAAEPDDHTYRVVGDGDPLTRRPALRSPRDELSAEESSYALHLALADGVVPGSATNVVGESGAEVLQIEVPSELSGDHRVAVVDLHDYTDDVGYQLTVDLSTGRVRAERSPLLQGRISAAEAEAALHLAIDHTPTLTFARQFETAQGVPLLSPDQVTSVAGVYRHDGSQAATTECGRHRCVQLMIQGPSGVYLAAWDFVVDLTARQVITFGASHHVHPHDEATS